LYKRGRITATERAIRKTQPNHEKKGDVLGCRLTGYRETFLRKKKNLTGKGEKKRTIEEERPSRSKFVKGKG